MYMTYLSRPRTRIFAMWIMKFPILALQMLHTKFGQVVLEKKMLTNYARRMTYDGRQPIAIGHLSDSSDLKR